MVAATSTGTLGHVGLPRNDSISSILEMSFFDINALAAEGHQIPDGRVTNQKNSRAEHMLGAKSLLLFRHCVYIVFNESGLSSRLNNFIVS